MQRQSVQTKPVGGRTAAFVFGLLLLVGVYIWVQSLASHTTTPPPPESTVQLGTDGRLRNPRADTVALALSADDMEAAIHAAAVGDTVELQHLSGTGHLVQMTNGTRVHVIDVTARLAQPMSKVRVLDGSRAGESGWVLDSSLVP